jgi:lysophospholipase L1-like esterase
MHKIVTILGDSLALVRPEDDISETDLYSYKIQSRYFDEFYVLNKAMKSNDTRFVNSREALVYQIQAARSSFFVIHLGLVDCTPRLFTSSQHSLLGEMTQLPILEKLAHWIIKQRSKRRMELTKKRVIFRTTVEEYEENLNGIVEKIHQHNPVERIFLINIAFPGKNFVSRNYDVVNHIKKYNEVLERIAKKSDVSLVDINSATLQHPEFLLSDGQHLSKLGHDFLAKRINDELAAFIGSPHP